MEPMEQRVTKIETEVSLLTQAVNEIKDSLKGINSTLKQLISLQTDNKLLEQKLKTLVESNNEAHKRMHDRLDKVEGNISWVSKTIIGALITGGVSAILIFIKGH
jgi:archaellum component FlaC